MPRNREQARQARQRKRQRRRAVRSAPRPGGPPDATEALTQRLNQQMREKMLRSFPEDGAVSAPLEVAADYAAERLVEAFELEGGDDVAGVSAWLTGHWRQTILDFDAGNYLQWRRDCARRVRIAWECEQAGPRRSDAVLRFIDAMAG